MATTEEIERRVEDADAARSARRSAAAQQIGELAARRATIAEQLRALEQKLGDVLADSSDVLEIGELAEFTDVPAADLTRWLNERKPNRSKRKKPAPGSSNGKRTRKPPEEQETSPPRKFSLTTDAIGVRS